MATPGGANPWVVSMQSGQGGAVMCKPSSSCSLLLLRAPSCLSLVASPSARFVSILSSPRCNTPPLNVLAIHAQDPDFYKIPYVEGIPVGKRLKLWNLPPNCKHSELLEWFAGADVKVDSLEFTDDPVLNAQGIGGFVEFATKQHACIAIVRLDGYKFRGHYIRMDFAEKRPHSRDYGSRRNRPNRSSGSSGSRGSFATASRPPVTDMVRSYSGSTSSNTQLTPMYEVANSSTLQTSSGYGSSIQSGSSYDSMKDTAYSNSISPSNGDSKPPSVTQSSPSHGSVDSQAGSSYGNLGTQLNNTATRSSVGSSQILSDSSSTKSSLGSVSVPPQPSVGEAQSSARSSSTQDAPIAYGGTKKNPIGTVSSNGGALLRSPVAQGPPPRSLNPSYAKVEQYEDFFKNYGAPDAAVVEPWSQNTSFRSGPMFGSPQPSSLNRLFVGNLAVSIDDAALHELFGKFGTVLEARVLRDQESGRSRGFAVVAMASVDEMQAASKALDGWRVESRSLKVDAVTFKH